MTPQVTFCPEDLPGLWIRPHKYTLSQQSTGWNSNMEKEKSVLNGIS